MKNYIKYSSIFLLCLFFLGACSPQKYSLGETDVTSTELVEGIAFKIEHDNSNPNIVYLTSLMGTEYTPLWDHPQGRSQAQRVTLKIPFAGEYAVTFGVQTRGGVVYGKPVTFKVDNMYAEFISDEMWTLLSGGAGESKTWYLDLDADGLSRYFKGPMYFYGTGDWWGTVAGTGAALNSDSWNWAPDWKGNSWIMPAGDYGSMTFDLKGGANINVNHAMLGKTQKGVFNIDVEKKTMRMTGASPLHGQPQDGIVVDWGDIRIMSLTKNTMQLAVLRDPVLSKEGAAMLTFNFISKEYKDNWVPTEEAEPEPPYQGNPNSDLTTSTSTKKVWKLSLATPYNWASLKGEMLNSWSSAADYAATGWAPYDAALIQNVRLTLDKTGDQSGNYSFTTGDGSVISGTYTIDDKNNIIFDKAISFAISSWVSLATGAENQLRIISTTVNAAGQVTGIWLGQRSTEKEEYMTFKFESL